MKAFIIATLVLLCIVLIAHYFGATEKYEEKLPKSVAKLLAKLPRRAHADAFRSISDGAEPAARAGGAAHQLMLSGAHHTASEAGRDIKRVTVAGVAHETSRALGAAAADAPRRYKVSMPDGATHEIEADGAQRRHEINVGGARHTHSGGAAAGARRIEFPGGVVHDDADRDAAGRAIVRAPAGARDTEAPDRDASGVAVREIVTADGAVHRISPRAHEVEMPGGAKHKITDDSHEVMTPSGYRHTITAESHVAEALHARAVPPEHRARVARRAVVTAAGAAHIETADGGHHSVAEGVHHAVTADGVRHVSTDAAQHLTAHARAHPSARTLAQAHELAHEPQQRIFTADGVDHVVHHARAAGAAPHPDSEITHVLEIGGVRSEFVHKHGERAAHRITDLRAGAEGARAAPREARIVTPEAAHEVRDGVHKIETPQMKHIITAAAHTIEPRDDRPERSDKSHIITPDAHYAREGGARDVPHVHHMSFPTGIVRATRVGGAETVHMVHLPDGVKHSVHESGKLAGGPPARAPPARAQHVIFPDGAAHRIDHEDESNSNPHALAHHVVIGGVAHKIVGGVHTVKLPGKLPMELTAEHPPFRVRVGGAEHEISLAAHHARLPDGTRHSLSADGTHQAVTSDGSRHTISPQGVHHVMAARGPAPATHVIEPDGTHHTMSALHGAHGAHGAHEPHEPHAQQTHTVFTDGTVHGVHAHGVHAHAQHQMHARKITTADGVSHTAIGGRHVIESADGVVHKIEEGRHTLQLPAEHAQAANKAGIRRFVTATGTVHVLSGEGAALEHKIVSPDGTAHTIAVAHAQAQAQAQPHLVTHIVHTPTHLHTVRLAATAAGAAHEARGHAAYDAHEVVAHRNAARATVAHDGATRAESHGGAVVHETEPSGAAHTFDRKEPGAPARHTSISKGVVHVAHGAHGAPAAQTQFKELGEPQDAIFRYIVDNTTRPLIDMRTHMVREQQPQHSGLPPVAAEEAMPEAWRALKAKPSWQPTAASELSALSALGSFEGASADERSLDAQFARWD